MIRDTKTINSIVVHHSASANSTIQSIDRNHRYRLHPYPNGYGYHIAYHFVIDKEGIITKARPLKEVGYHAGNWGVNKTSLGVCLIGNFQYEKPEKKQLQALKNLIVELISGLLNDNIEMFGHKDIKPTSCPGLNLYPEVVKIKEVIENENHEEIEFLSSMWTEIEENKINAEQTMIRIGQRADLLRSLGFQNDDPKIQFLKKLWLDLDEERNDIQQTQKELHDRAELLRKS